METVDLLASNSMFFVGVVALFSLLVGSFLNVVIYRLPIMLEREWRKQATDILSGNDRPLGNETQEKEPAFNLVVPRSSCPKCNAPITAMQNIPVVSYLLLRGKCAGCGTRIPLRYPVIETLTAILSMVVAIQFGFTWFTALGMGLTWCLIALSVIDFDHQLLPDQITLPLVWMGLFVSLFAVPGTPFAPDMRSSIIGGIAGYLSLWSVYWLFKLLTGKEGMGYGDFKLLAAFGTWLGWQPLLLIVLLSALAGAVIGIGLIVFRGRDRNIPIPYGPYLAIAGWIAMLWGHQMIGAYLSMSNLQH
jgi:leader peptidase (prepilin peptidase)/N-methyltransferase